MAKIVINSEGLWVHDWDSDKRETEVFRADEDRVLTHLSETCEIEEGTTLLDIFNMVESYEMLKIVISQYAWCSKIDEFHAQAKEPYTPKDDDEKIDYLEIYHHATISSGHFNSYDGFHGVGPEPPDYEHPTESGMITYSVSYSPMYELAYLPVVLNTDFVLYGGTTFIKGKGARTKTLCQATLNYTLLEVLHAIYDDISFMGGPEDNAAFIEDMKERVDDVKEKLDAGDYSGLTRLEFPDDPLTSGGDPEHN